MEIIGCVTISRVLWNEKYSGTFLVLSKLWKNWKVPGILETGYSIDFQNCEGVDNAAVIV